MTVPAIAALLAASASGVFDDTNQPGHACRCEREHARTRRAG
jgi:hypothetical protein